MGSRQTIGGWSVVRRLGKRGERSVVMPRRGRSYLVRLEGSGDPTTRELHAIDTPEPEALAAEVERYRRLDHPALPSVRELFVLDRRVFVVVDHLDGVGLDRLEGYLHRDRERLPDAAIWFVSSQLFGALASGHAARDEQGRPAPLCHGGPSLVDVFVTRDGGVKILGLCPGLVAVPSEGAADSWRPLPLAPSDQPSAEADVRSAALVVRALLTGRSPDGEPRRGPLTRLRPDVSAEVTEALDLAREDGGRGDAAGGDAAALAHRFDALGRSTEGQRALGDAMELYQALWGLWHVASADTVSAEEPIPLSHKLPGMKPVIREVEELDEKPSPDAQLDAPTTGMAPRASAAEDQQGTSTPLVVGEDGARATPGAAVAEARSTLDVDTPSDFNQEVLRKLAEATPKPPAPAARGDAGATEPIASSAEPDDDLAPASARWAVLVAVAVAVILTIWWSSRTTGSKPPVVTTSAPEVVTSPDHAPVAGEEGAAETAPVSQAPPGTAQDGGGEHQHTMPEGAVAEGGAPASGERGSAGGAARSADLDLSALQYNQGYFIVESSVDAPVVIQGKALGRTNEPIKSWCLHRFVRLGEPGAWVSGGRTVKIECGTVTRLRIEPAGD